MTHYLYKPHVHGPEFITTPDILVDRLFRLRPADQGFDLVPASVQGVNTLPEVQCAESSVTITPAVFLIAAGAGTLVSVGAEVLADEVRSIRVARFAWRLKYLIDHLDKINLLVSGGEGNSTEILMNALPAPADITNYFGDGLNEVPRGIIVSVTAPGTMRQSQVPGTVSIKLTDGHKKRTMEHRLNLHDANSDCWETRPQPRYTVGPQTAEVQHFV
ncbi:MAG: hypothetical protein HN764_14775 [Gammaproteobacteria bacterium]|jgi:hypothetical protein|nr:hypothetical protein [Gammaproteobacteria bacterium]